MKVSFRIARFGDSRTPALRAEWERQEQTRALLRLHARERYRGWPRHNGNTAGVHRILSPRYGA